MRACKFSNQYYFPRRRYLSAAHVMQRRNSKHGSCSVSVGVLHPSYPAHRHITGPRGLSAYHAGPKTGVGRFQLGFFRVLYLQISLLLSDILTHVMGPIRHGKGSEAV